MFQLSRNENWNPTNRLPSTTTKLWGMFITHFNCQIYLTTSEKKHTETHATHTQLMLSTLHIWALTCVRVCVRVYVYFELVTKTFICIHFRFLFFSLFLRGIVITTENVHMSIGFHLQNTRANRDGIKDVSVTLVPLAYEKTDNNIIDPKKVSALTKLFLWVYWI